MAAQWLRSATACLLGLWIRIPLGHGCLSLVIVVCCQAEVSAMADPSSREVLPSVVCDGATSVPRRPGPTRAVEP